MDFRYYIEIFTAFIGVLMIALGVVMLLTRRDKSDVWCFTCAIFSSAVWILSVYFSNISTNLESLTFWTKVASITALVYTIFFTLFAYAFRFGKLQWKTVGLISLPGIINIIYLYAFDPALIYVSNPFDGFGYDMPVGGVLSSNFSAFLILFFVYYLAGLAILLWNKSQLNFHQRLQIKYISFGVSISILAAVVFDILLPIYGIDYVYALGPACSIFLVGAISYAIVQHNLLDIRVVIQRGLIYSVLFAIFILLYVSAISLLGLLVQDVTQIGVIFIAGIVALISIIGASPVEKMFRRVTNRWFFKDRYNYAEALHDLSQILNTEFELGALKEEVTLKLQKIFHTSKAFVFDTETENDYEVSVKVETDDRVIGFLALGQKRSGDPYTDEDMSLLHTFANQLAVALERATLVTKLKENAEHLEEKVSERTDEVRLLQAKQSYLIENMSHELQMPLTVLKAELEELRSRGLLPNLGVQFEKSIDEASRRLYKLMKLAKIQATAETLKFQVVDFSLMLEEIMEYLDVVCKDNNITVTSQIQKEVMVLGQEEGLNDLVINLMSNAIKYIAGDRKINVKLTQNQEVVLEVSDTGVGISSDDLPHVFNRFYHSKSNTVSPTPSTGLGLAICQQIVESHGGKILVESSVGKGSIFSVILPKHESPS